MSLRMLFSNRLGLSQLVLFGAWNRTRTRNERHRVQCSRSPMSEQYRMRWSQSNISRLLESPETVRPQLHAMSIVLETRGIG